MYCLISREIKNVFFGFFFFTELNAAGKDIFYQKNMTNFPQSPHQTW